MVQSHLAQAVCAQSQEEGAPFLMPPLYERLETQAQCQHSTVAIALNCMLHYHTKHSILSHINSWPQTTGHKKLHKDQTPHNFWLFPLARC